jgi:triacylglycerol lipase
MMGYDASRAALYRPETKPVFLNFHTLSPFQPKRSGFSAVNGWWLANAAHLAYYAADRLEENLRRAGLRLVARFSEGSTQAYLAAGDTFAVLSFRGTQPGDWADVRADADLRLAPFRGDARVHRGFLAALDQVWEALAGRLENIVAQGLPVWYTGHSLGAALATLAAARIPPAALYTFGSPRVGNEPFVQLLGGVPVQRVVNCSDAATGVPGRVLGYRHVGDVRFITAWNRVLENPGRWETFRAQLAGTARFLSTVPWYRSGMVKARPFADHAIVNYAYALREALERHS